MKNSFVMYANWLDMIAELDEKGRSELLMAIMLYQNGKDVPDDMSIGARVAFAQIKGQFVKDNEKYEEIVQKRKEAGKAGGLAKASTSKQMLASASKSKQSLANSKQSLANLADNDNDNDNNRKESIKEKSKQDKAFDEFWAVYPKKKSKGAALKAWKKLNPSDEIIAAIMSKIPELKKSPEWKKDGGQYIPYPATWLNAEGWLDEVDPARATPATPFGGFEQRGYDYSELGKKLFGG